MNFNKKIITWLLTGIAMGAANVIPGVSGGTIAFITGVYQRLIDALKSFNLETIKLLFSGKINEFISRTDLKFLAILFSGTAISIISFAKIMQLALLHYEQLTMAFFFGLIIASILSVGKKIDHWRISTIISLTVGTGIAAIIGLLPPASANPNFLYLVICGIVAISSMILPGLSGSYVLLLMGNYLLVLQAISSFQFSILIPMALGCIIGLAGFSRILSYLFQYYQTITTALLTGFVAGSLLIIWPWKTTLYLPLVDGKQKATGYQWNLPEINVEFFGAVILVIIGFILVWALDRKQYKSE